ncbi:LLM class flavin-dependent oxidoreductase [Amycolatopsis sp. NPDC051903]|uniref:LLM class flavin-dependent oxidoreductase n=1 Tax=Amycolatopsis sp. NPDC051903 TaxID=3363936 RepID=UPI0037A7E2E4
MTEFWTSAWNARADEIIRQARQAQDAGFDGMFITDSQNLWLECWVALTVAATATTTLKLGTAVTNPVTRHAAVNADAAASLQEVSGGRVVLGVGRGDSALAYLGRAPAPLRRFERYLTQLQGYLRGEEVSFDDEDLKDLPKLDTLGYETAPSGSRIRWLPGTQPKVPVDVAGSGPKVLRLAARHADGVTFGVGADVTRLRAMLELTKAERAGAGLADHEFTRSALITVVPHRDRAQARKLAAGGVALAGRWSVMQSRARLAGVDDRTREQLEAARTSYDMTHHGENRSSHAAAMSDELIDRFAVAGPPEYCVRRLTELKALGLDRIIFATRIRGASEDEQAEAEHLLLDEVLPHVSEREGAPR